VRNGLLHHRHGDEVFLGLLDGFANRFWNFAGFADRKTDLTLAIADYDERAEAKALTAFATRLTRTTVSSNPLLSRSRPPR
jgi:hypothetical protein